MAGYKGAWRGQRLYVDQRGSLGRPELSALHQDPDHIEAGARPPYAAPRVQPAPPNVIDPGTAYDEVLPQQAPGVVLDHSPITHEGDAGAGGGQSLPAAQAAANAARSRDDGAAYRQLWEEPAARPADQTQSTDQLVVEPISGGSRLQAVRGANSLPENNPDGFRPGRRVQRFVNRRLWQRTRRHDLRPLAPLNAASAVVSPPLTNGNRNTSPYGWTQRAKTRKWYEPTQRRTPRDWDEPVVTDGTATAAGDTTGHPEFVSWGL